ncbi:myocyte-specific enhancer factor 2d [Diplocarpon rosae]|nr:myocyte-specific enhancer factor 2d [Diplocarpon rosae]
MAQPIRDIPGYYFDQEKNKYFKIQPQGPTSSAYSGRDVKRRKLRDEKELAVRKEKQRQAGRIQRSKFLGDPLIGGVFTREYGYSGFDPARIVAVGLVRCGTLCTKYLGATNIIGPMRPQQSVPLFTIDRQPDYGSSVVRIHYAQESRFRTIRTAVGTLNRFSVIGRDNTCEDYSAYYTHEGEPTSITENESSHQIAVTRSSGSLIDGIDIHFDPKEIGYHGNAITISMTRPGYARSNCIYMYSSTAAPPSSSLLFAFGSSEGILATDKEAHNTTWLTPKPSKDPTQSDDLFALAFVTSSPSVLLSGGRKGLLKITDLRVPVFGLDADTIIHSSTITHIQVLDTHRIIVNGLDSSLCQYDMRFRKTDTTRSILKKKARAQRNMTPTRSILQYEDFQNNATIQIGFDVDLDSGIVAAAQEFDEFHKSVQLFSLHGGHKLDSPNVSEYLPNSEAGRTVKCLRFAQDSDAGMKSLYIGRGLDIQRYSWGEDDNESERKVVLDYEN